MPFNLYFFSFGTVVGFGNCPFFRASAIIFFTLFAVLIVEPKSEIAIGPSTTTIGKINADFTPVHMIPVPIFAPVAISFNILFLFSFLSCSSFILIASGFPSVAPPTLFDSYCSVILLPKVSILLDTLSANLLTPGVTFSATFPTTFPYAARIGFVCFHTSPTAAACAANGGTVANLSAFFPAVNPKIFLITLSMFIMKCKNINAINIPVKELSVRTNTV